VIDTLGSTGRSRIDRFLVTDSLTALGQRVQSDSQTPAVCLHDLTLAYAQSPAYAFK